MLNKLKNVMMLAGLFLACVQVSHATVPVLVTTTTNVSGTPILMRTGANDGVTATIFTTATVAPGCTVQFQFSTTGSNWTTLFSTATGGGGSFGNNGFSTVFPPMPTVTFWRFNIVVDTTSGGPVPVTYTIASNDDNNISFRNNKNLDSIYFNNNSVNIFGTLKPDRIQAQIVSTTTVVLSSPSVVMSSFTQLIWQQSPPQNRNTWPFTANFSTNAPIIDKSFVVITSTCSDNSLPINCGLTLSAVPTISTTAAVNGDRIEIMVGVGVSSITFTDQSGLTTSGVGSALKLGAPTRSLGMGDMLGLVFYNGFWREEFFSNVIETNPF